MRYFLDTEFNGYGGKLISLALVSEDGRELYVATECRRPVKWVKANVMPVIDCAGASPTMIDPDQFGEHIASFVDAYPTIIADWPDDVRYLCETLVAGPGKLVTFHLFNPLKFEIHLVETYPNDLPDAVQHNALWDARAIKHMLLEGGCSWDSKFIVGKTNTRAEKSIFASAFAET